MALAAYRQLFRATRIAFGADLPILQASREQIREGFRNNRSLESPSPELDKAIEHAKGVAEVLRSNIVQGKKVEGEATYKLNIHEDTERGDNDTVKNPLGKGGVVKVGC